MPRLPIITCVLLTAVPLLAHGGAYRGPGDVKPVPTSSSGGSASSGANSGTTRTGSSSSGASNSGPATPGPSAAPPANGGRAVPRGITLADDPTRWDYWWEFRKDPWLRLRDSMRAIATDGDAQFLGARRHVAGLQPVTPDDLDRRIVPALVAALERATDRDTVTGCMVALAKMGRDPATAQLRDLFAPRLRSHDQEVRETAALCFGIAGAAQPGDLDLLLALASDSDAGRKACDHPVVDQRTRSFACYALGILLHDDCDLAARQRVLRGITPLLAADPSTERDLLVAAIATIAQVPAGNTAGEELLRTSALEALLEFYARDLGPGAQLVQAHCPPAIAQLLTAGSSSGPMALPAAGAAIAARARARFTADLTASLDTEVRRSNHHLAQSCALALGALAAPWDDDKSADRPLGELLLRVWRDHRDQQTRAFALMALARQGGAAAQAALLTEFGDANRAQQRPWLVLALGTMVAQRYERARAEGRMPDADPTLAKALVKALGSYKNPEVVGATAIAIGLCQDRSAVGALHDVLQHNQGQDELMGQCAIALALLGDDSARVELRELMVRSLRRPLLLAQLATALGRLGDPNVLDDLLGLLRDSDAGLARLSALAMAIGQIGDRRAIEPLLAMLQNEQLTPLTRAFAAVAIGGAADRRALPWNARYAAVLNYRAAVDTLTDGAAGILDIL